MIYQEDLSPVGRFLVLGARGELSGREREELLQLHDRLGPTTCFEAAGQNQIGALVARRLVDVADGDIAPLWAQLLDSNRQRVDELVQLMLSVTRRLDHAEIGWALIENGGVLFASDMPLDAFCAGDFDLLIERSRWADAIQIFAASGFRPEDRRARPTNRIEFVRHGPDGSARWLNAGSQTFDRMLVPLPVIDLGQEWLARRTRSSRDDRVWVLRPEAALALVAIHTSLHSFIRAPGLRLHVDADRLVRSNTIAWDEVVEQIHRMGAPTRAFISLSMARGMLESPVPDGVLEALFPGRARWAAVRRLLLRHGVVADASPKLPRLEAVILDALVDERALWRWLMSSLFPSAEWLQRYSRPGRSELALKLHLRRAGYLLHRWRPE